MSLSWSEECQMQCKRALGHPQLRYYIPETERTILWTHLLTYLPSGNLFQILCIAEKKFSYATITVYGDISLFQIEDNSGGMFSITKSGLCQSTKHLLSWWRQRGETSAVLPPSCWSQTRRRRFIIIRRLHVRLQHLKNAVQAVPLFVSLSTLLAVSMSTSSSI